MDTIKLDRNTTRIISDGGNNLSEADESLYSFLGAANRNYDGIGCHIRFTKDRVMICSRNRKLAGCDDSIAQTTYDKIKALPVKTTIQNRFCELSEFLSIAKHYNKMAFITLCPPIGLREIDQIKQMIHEFEYDCQTMILSDDKRYLKEFRKDNFDILLGLTGLDYQDEYIKEAQKYHFVLWFRPLILSQDFIDFCHSEKIQVGLERINNPIQARYYIEMGLDFLTTAILEAKFIH